MVPAAKLTAFRQSALLVCGLLIVGTIEGVVHGDEADDLYTFAAKNYDQQRWDLAIAEFKELLRRYPDHARADPGTFYLGQALLYSGAPGEAADHFRRYLTRRGDGPLARAALFRAGEASYMAQEYARAKDDLIQFRSRYATDRLNACVLPYLGDIAMTEGSVATAENYFRSGLQEFPQGKLADDCRFGLAQALERQSRNDEAERLYVAVADNPDSRLADDARFHLGALQYAAGKYAAAIETFTAFETKLTASPWTSHARLGRGWALMKLDRLDEAKPWFESIASDPKIGIEARYGLGLVQRRQEDWSAAAETLSAAATAEPEHELVPAVRFHAGDALRHLGKTAEARAQFDLVIVSAATGNEWVDDAVHAKIQMALEEGDHDALDRTADDFLQRFPQSPLKENVRRLRARSLLKRKRFDEALNLIEPLVAVGGFDEMGLEDRYLLASANEGLERYEEALIALTPVLGSTNDRLKADAQLTEGCLLTALDRHADAVKSLEAFLGTGPAEDLESKARAELSVCYARTGQLDKAKEQYRALAQKHPQHPRTIPLTERLADAAYEAGDAAWSAELFGLVTDGASDERELRGLAGLGWSQLKAGRPEEAAAAFEKLLKKNPPAPMASDAALAQGRILEELGRHDPALAMYDLVIDRYPKEKQHAEALLAAARLRDRLQQDREAVALYQRLTQEYPQLPELDAVLYEWAWSLDELNEKDASSDLFEQLRSRYPQSRFRADATFRLARRAFEAEDYQRAKQLTGEVLGGKPDARIREHALSLSGQIAVAEEDWPLAGEVFDALVREFPESPNRLVAEYWTAEAAYRGNDYAKAGESFDRLASQTRGRRDAWLAMIPLRQAQVLWHQEKYAGALAIASKIEGDFPDFSQQHEADYLIGRCLASRADFEGARKAYDKVIYSPTGEGTETAAMARWMIGETYFHQEKYDAALREYLRLESRYAYPTWQAAALLQAGKCRDLLGESAEARKLYTQLIEQHPDTPFAEDARKRLGDR
ncbi:MAG TPA: tetratricopeptide repeat protein [Thermoguttaceae bacterium]|nr:tetratricopeptide repeat protein [Thermoguttaceae bacterium]